MAQVIASYSGTVTGSGNIYVYKQANNASGTNGFYTSGNSVMIYAKNGIPEESNGFYRIGSSPGGWMYTYNVTNIQPNYQTVTDPCTKPDSVELDTQTKVLTIVGGDGGDNNALVGWGVSYAEADIGMDYSPQNLPYGDELTEEDLAKYSIWSSDTDTDARTIVVTVPAGKKRIFKARTKGEAGANYYSAYTLCNTELYGISPCTAPNSIIASDPTPIGNSYVTISWSGASGGVNNDITGYEIYRSGSAAGPYNLLGSVESTETSGQYGVVSHADFGGSYYYKVRTKGSSGSNYYSTLSTVYAVVTSGYGMCVAPSEVKVSSSSAYPGALVKLMWSGAEGGYMNAITGYEVSRATSPSGPYNVMGSTSTSSSGGRALVVAPATVGTVFYYKVKTLGAISGYNSGLSAARATLMAAEPAVLAGTTGRTNAVIE